MFSLFRILVELIPANILVLRNVKSIVFRNPLFPLQLEKIWNYHRLMYLIRYPYWINCRRFTELSFYTFMFITYYMKVISKLFKTINFEEIDEFNEFSIQNISK